MNNEQFWGNVHCSMFNCHFGEGFHMRFRFVVAIMITIALSAIPAAAQAPKPPAKAWTVQRMPDGHPDLQGIWNYSTLTPVERPKDLADKPFFTEQEAAAY